MWTQYFDFRSVHAHGNVLMHICWSLYPRVELMVHRRTGSLCSSLGGSSLDLNLPQWTRIGFRSMPKWPRTSEGRCFHAPRKMSFKISLIKIPKNSYLEWFGILVAFNLKRSDDGEVYWQAGRKHEAIRWVFLFFFGRLNIPHMRSTLTKPK